MGHSYKKITRLSYGQCQINLTVFKTQYLIKPKQETLTIVAYFATAISFTREYLRRKYHCTVDLLFNWFGLVCFANKNKVSIVTTADSKPVKQEVNGTVILLPKLPQ